MLVAFVDSKRGSNNKNSFLMASVCAMDENEELAVTQLHAIGEKGMAANSSISRMSILE